TGVDAVSRREFWDQLHLLRDSGLTVIVSTPYMDEAMRCDRVALIQGGRLLEIDPPTDIGRHYPLPLVAVTSNDRYQLLLALRKAPHVHSVFPFGAELHYTDNRPGANPSTVSSELDAYMKSQGFVGATAHPISAGIEDSFMELMSAPAQKAS
ncbi:MAG: ABC transporter ATP-binding protein, partial [Gemmatimonadales bacterium]